MSRPFSARANTCESLGALRQMVATSRMASLPLGLLRNVRSRVHVRERVGGIHAGTYLVSRGIPEPPFVGGIKAV